MASSYSFDVVSDFDRQELVNALDQARREIVSRFDLKDTKTELLLEDQTLRIHTASEFTLQAVVDIVQSKAIKRNLSLKIFDYQPVQPSSGDRVVQVIALKKGIDQEQAKKISKQVRDQFPKIQAAIQGDAVRITSKSKDELQAVIQWLKAMDCPLALQFTNYR